MTYTELLPQTSPSGVTRSIPNSAKVKHDAPSSSLFCMNMHRLARKSDCSINTLSVLRQWSGDPSGSLAMRTHLTHRCNQLDDSAPSTSWAVICSHSANGLRAQPAFGPIGRHAAAMRAKPSCAGGAAAMAEINVLAVGIMISYPLKQNKKNDRVQVSTSCSGQQDDCEAAAPRR
eukprot:2041230-Pleurochrysis_carterae.AAC.5